MKAGETLHNIGAFARENRGKIILGLVTVAALATVEAPFAQNSLRHLLDLMASGALAAPTWELPTKQGLVELLQTPEGTREVARWVAIDGIIALAGGVLHKGISSVLNEARSERMRLGIEPLPRRLNPSHVFIGPSQVISDLASTVTQRRPKKKGKPRPVVGIHIDTNIPPRFGQEMTYHLKAADLNEIIGTHAATSRRELSFIEAAGIDRANEITIACFNPDNALFYGIQSELQIPASFVSTLIRAMPPERLIGKKVSVILSGEEYFGRTTPVEEELRALADKLRFELKIVKPEALVLDKIAKRLRSIAQTKPDGDLDVVLAGEGKTQTDELMLNRFSEALSQQIIEGRKIKVHIVSHNLIDGKPVADRDQTDTILKDLLTSSHLNLCYGDTDIGTSTVAALLMQILGAERSQTLALVERNSSRFDFMQAGIKALPIYQLVLDQI